MRWLKGLVIGMGVLIVAGTTLLVVELARRATVPPETATPRDGRLAPPLAGMDMPGEPGAAAAARPFGETRIALPPGALVEETTMGEGRVVLRLSLPDGDGALLLIDARTGRRLGLVRLEVEGGAAAEQVR